MAGFTVEKLSAEPIIYVKTLSNYDRITELALVIDHMRAALDVQSMPVYVIIDSTEEPPISINELTEAASVMLRGEQPIYHHRNIRNLLVASTNGVLRMAYQGANSEVFGYLKPVLFDKTADALAHARAGL
jgi:hypothetical protein